MISKLTATTPEILLETSPQFKKEALRAVLGIICFIVVYLFLFALSLCLVALCFYAGGMVMIAKPGGLTILFGLGAIGCGIMVFVFLIKFLFASSQADETDSIELSEADYPKLFQSIRSIAEQVGTQMPKKVFISPDVNACVFYNSSFWSMFLPVRKNLKIGLGLVNAVNISELEAVIAHEFGHFSQKSMKVGSWVHQVNRIIYDMLFNNQHFAKGLDSLAKVHGIFYLFAILTIKIIQGIQWVLRQVYKVVNKSYLGLSRQMEFHADLVAASIYGSNNVIHALLRSELASACYETTLDICTKAWQEKKVASEFYAAHSFVLQHVGQDHQFTFQGNLPVIKEQEGSNFSRINYKDQWSSHPTIQERKMHLEPFNLTAGVNNSSAWFLFREETALKNSLTKKLYRNIPQEEIKEVLDLAGFEVFLKKELDRASFPPLFKGYYDLRQVEAFDVEEVSAEPFVFTTFEEVFDEDTASIPKKLRFLRQDLAVLQAIESGHIETRSFDFEGQKYKVKEAPLVINQLQEELRLVEERLKASDRRLFRYFYAVSQLSESEALKKDYQAYFHKCTESDSFIECVNAMMEPLGPIFRGETIPVETILEKINKLKKVHEPAFKSSLQQWSECFSSVSGLRESVDKFLSSDYQYFHEQSFFENELQELNNLVQDCWEEISTYLLEQFKAITVKQAQIVVMEADEQKMLQGQTTKK